MSQKWLAVQILYSRPSSPLHRKPLKLPVQKPPGPEEKFENRLLGPTDRLSLV
jgi:hypothetical protein